MTTEIFRVIASFKNAAGEPLSGEEYAVCLRDRDRFFDDKLGETTLTAEGNAEFMVYTADILSFDSAGERTPDLYFVVFKNAIEIFRTEVFDEVDFDAKDPVTDRPRLTRSFGPFQVPEP